MKGAKPRSEHRSPLFAAKRRKSSLGGFALREIPKLSPSFSLRIRGGFDTLVRGNRLILARFRANNARIAALLPPRQFTDDRFVVLSHEGICPRQRLPMPPIFSIPRRLAWSNVHGMKHMVDAMVWKTAEVARC